MKNTKISLQIASKAKHIPSSRLFKKWIIATLENTKQKNLAEIHLRVINKKESALLNKTYRNKSGPTNVLSFVYDTNPVFGDIALCAPLITQQAKGQQKSINAHWAHLIVHGCLHLLGYDHIKKSDAIIMEKREIAILTQLGFNNPY